MKQRLIVRWKDGYANIAITRIEKIGDVVYAYDEDGFAGMFDLGAVDVLYKAQKGEE